MKNDKLDTQRLASMGALITAICMLGISSLSLIFHYTFSEDYRCQSGSNLIYHADYEILSSENIANLEIGYVMLKTFRTTTSEIYPDTRIHQSVILSKDIDYQFQINCTESQNRQIIFEIYTPHEENLIKTFSLNSNQTKLNVKVPKTGLYVLKLYDKNPASTNLFGVLTIGGQSR